MTGITFNADILIDRVQSLFVGEDCRFETKGVSVEFPDKVLPCYYLEFQLTCVSRLVGTTKCITILSVSVAFVSRLTECGMRYTVGGRSGKS